MDDPIRIGDKEYKFDDLPPKAQKMIMYMQQIDAQLDQMKSQMDILQLSREACYGHLNTELEKADGEQEIPT